MGKRDLSGALAGRVAERLAAVGVRAGAGVVAGVSGGGDSVALLWVLVEARADLGFALTAAHLHHGLRGIDADADAAFVRALCHRLDVRLEEARVDVAAQARTSGLSLEMAGRLCRRRFLFDVRDRAGARFVALGHHADDLAETLLLRLERGSGLLGAGAMSPIGPDGIIRPLLDERRATLRAYLAAHDQPWREDDSNSEPATARNRLRLRVLPAWEEVEPGVAAALARSARLLREDGVLLAAAVDHLLPAPVPDNGGPWRVLPAALWRDASHALRRQLLRQAAWSIAGAYPPAPWAEAWARWPERRESRPDLSWLRLAAVDGGAVLFRPAAPARLSLPAGPPPWRLSLPDGATLSAEAWRGDAPDRPALSLPAEVRHLAPKEALDGHNGALFARTLLAGRGVPAPCRAAAWIVEDRAGRRWLPSGPEDSVPGVGTDGRALRIGFLAPTVWPAPGGWPRPGP